MIDNRCCQRCGQDVGPDGAFFPQSMKGLPFCKSCAEWVVEKEKECYRNHGRLLVPTQEVIDKLRGSPLEFHRKWRGGKAPRGFEFWVPAMTIYVDLSSSLKKR